MRLTKRERAAGHERSVEFAPIPGPDAVRVTPRHLEVGGSHCTSLTVTGYPAEVHAGWLEPLLTYPGRLDVSLHITPIDPTTAATKLRRQRARMESNRRSDYEHGRLLDPEAEAAAQDAADLAYRLARGEGKLFRVGLYLTVYAESERSLEREVAAVRSLAASLLVTTAPTTYRSLEGWSTCLPLGIDAIGTTRTFDTAALAAAFPFTSPDLAPADPAQTTPSSGILYGANPASSGLVLWDRWAQDNHNSVVLARSGSGKSYFTKCEVLRNLYQGVQVFVIDPEHEYTRLANAVGGSVLSLGADGVRLNPFDLPQHTTQEAGPGGGSNALFRRALFIHTFIQVLLARTLSAAERAGLDKAILAAYAGRGITSDPRSWARPAPVLDDLVDALTEGSEVALELAGQLEPFTRGSWAGLFDGPTSTHPAGHLVVFSLRELPDELRTVGTLLVLDAIWRQVTSPEIRRRLVVVDEAWLLMRDPEGAKFLLRMAKAARKRWAGLAVTTQDIADLLASELGAAIVANSATQVLFCQAPQALEAVVRAFRLSEGEAALIATAGPGLGLLAAGNARVAFQVIASDFEHHLASTSPGEVTDEQDGYFADPEEHLPPPPDTDPGEPLAALTHPDDPEGELL